MKYLKKIKYIFETDWLASKPVFYNEKLGLASYNINDVIDYKNLEFHPEGFNNYLDFGYSVFGQTPIKNVKFLEPCSKLTIFDDDSFKIELLPDPVEERINKPSSEDETMNLIRNYIKKVTNGEDKPVIIPTSGGFDSRLLNYFANQFCDLRAFTYGISFEQKNSFEVVYARKLTSILKIPFKQIFLGSYNDYIDDWVSLYGPSVHAHGQYHIEFFKKINALDYNDNLLLSGIVGDAWAGSISSFNVKNIRDLKKLGYSHDMYADVKRSKFKTSYSLRKKFLKKNKSRLSDYRWQIITTIRMKMILLSYLVNLPRNFGFRVKSPFLDSEIAMSMLNLPVNSLKKRSWQKFFFKGVGLDLESMGLKCSKSSSLNYASLEKTKLKPLDVTLLQEVVDSEYVSWINKKLSFSSLSFQSQLYKNTYIGYGLRKLGLHDPVMKAYFAYLTLYPIQSVLRKSRRIK